MVRTEGGWIVMEAPVWLCIFCKTSVDKVKWLIAAPDTTMGICDKCVKIAMEQIEENESSLSSDQGTRP